MTPLAIETGWHFTSQHTVDLVARVVAPQVKTPPLLPATELMVAAMQFLKNGEGGRARLAQALRALPEPEAAEAGPTVLRLRQVAAHAVSRENFIGLSRVALDSALREFCRAQRRAA
jgi:hypothetical protein